MPARPLSFDVVLLVLCEGAQCAVFVPNYLGTPNLQQMMRVGGQRWLVNPLTSSRHRWKIDALFRCFLSATLGCRPEPSLKGTTRPAQHRKDLFDCTQKRSSLA
eukprot:6490454-Amphidinium_carterae.5